MKRRTFLTNTLGASALLASPPVLAYEARHIEERRTMGYQIMREAHRGYSLTSPENTLLAFEEAIKVGVDRVELDLRLSSDGKLVVIHDETLDRTTNGKGMVAETSYSGIKKLDAGFWKDPKYKGLRIPLLQEVFELVKGKCMVNIDLKDAKAVKSMVKLSDSMKMSDNIVITGKIPMCVKSIRKANKGITMFYELPNELVKNEPKLAVKKIREEQLPGSLIHFEAANPGFIMESKYHGLSVSVWGVLLETDMVKLIELGVDSIMTDDLVTLNKVIKKMKF